MSTYRYRSGEDGNQYAGDATSFQLTKAEIFTSDGGSVDISRITYNIIIKHSLDAPFLDINLTVVDTQSVLETSNINTGERIQLTLERTVDPAESVASRFDTNRHVWEIDAYISEVSNMVRRDSGKQSFMLSLVTKEPVMNAVKELNRSFQGTPGDVIEGILKGDLGSEKYVVQANTNGVVKGIFPQLRPIQAVHWLMHNTSDAGTPFYFHFSLLEGLKVISYKELLNKGVYSTYKHIPFFKNSPGTTGSYREQAERVEAISSPLNMGKLGNIASGSLAASQTTIDISEKSVVTSEYSYDNSNVLKLNTDKPWTDMDTYAEPLSSSPSARSYNFSSNSKAFEGSTNVHGPIKDTLMVRNAYRNNLDYQEHSITIPGDFSIEPGVIIELQVMRVGDKEFQKDNNNDKRVDTFISGKYIVTDVVSTFDTEHFKQVLTIKRDSL